MGQAAGTAAALALTCGKMPKDIDMPGLQSALSSDGVYLGQSIS
jgi:hypothetical protein